jgi:hypothetical protein
VECRKKQSYSKNDAERNEIKCEIANAGRDKQSGVRVGGKKWFM